MTTSSLNLSAVAQEVLQREPEVLASVIRAYSLPPYPAGYRPTVVELLFDDLPYVRTVGGEIVYIRSCPDDYVPPFWELKFDGAMALFVVGTQVVINRVALLADWLAESGLLDSGIAAGRENNDFRN